MDEADKLHQNNDDMRKLINAGQTKSTASVMLNVPCGDGWEPRQFSTWAPIALRRHRRSSGHDRWTAR